MGAPLRLATVVVVVVVADVHIEQPKEHEESCIEYYSREGTDNPFNQAPRGSTAAVVGPCFLRLDFLACLHIERHTLCSPPLSLFFFYPLVGLHLSISPNQPSLPRRPLGSADTLQAALHTVQVGRLLHIQTSSSST